MTIQCLYLIGGQQRSPRPLFSNDQGWYEYQKGLILRVDLQSGTVGKVLEYVSKPEAYSPGDPILFKGGTIQDGRLYTCTQTEIIIYSLPSFEMIQYISLPSFNDIHHVKPTRTGNLLVANSGLEMVMEIKPDGQVQREWNVLDEDPWARFSKDVDYRKGINLKPHRAHPNHVFCIGDDIWVTRFELKDAICLTKPDRRLNIGLERIHDGTVNDGRLYFTTVDGNLVVADTSKLEIEEVIDLKKMHDSDILLGWCRGLLVDGNRVWVGFSRIRPTKFREAVSWVRQGLTRKLPSHIACYDIEQRRCIVDIDVEAHGLNAIFSILPAS